MDNINIFCSYNAVSGLVMGYLAFSSRVRLEIDILLKLAIFFVSVLASIHITTTFSDLFSY